MYVTIFSYKFHNHMFLSLKIINVLKKKKVREKSKQKEKYVYGRPFSGLCIFVYQHYILSTIFHLVSFPKIIYIFFHQKQILIKDFIIFRLKLFPKPQ